MANNYQRGPLISAGIFLGIGLGGFLDGIVFHQILQIHNMLSSQIPPDTLVNAKINMTWDGYFHAMVWIFTAIGMYRYFRRESDTMCPGRGNSFRRESLGMGLVQPG